LIEQHIHDHTTIYQNNIISSSLQKQKIDLEQFDQVLTWSWIDHSNASYSWIWRWDIGFKRLHCPANCILNVQLLIICHKLVRLCIWPFSLAQFSPSWSSS